MTEQPFTDNPTYPGLRFYRCLRCGKRWKGNPTEVVINGAMVQPACRDCGFHMVRESDES